MLLGALVHHGLLVDVSLRIALRFVAEAMAQPPGNKLLRFAQLALGEFRSDVGAWPDFCAQLLKVSLCNWRVSEAFGFCSDRRSGRAGLASRNPRRCRSRDMESLSVLSICSVEPLSRVLSRRF